MVARAGDNAWMPSLPPPAEPGPRAGRVFTARRIVRSTDVDRGGTLRLDAAARYLQSAAEDDLADSGLAEPVWWLVRRCALAITARPAAGEPLAIRTWCSATGPAWAERTTVLSGAAGELIRARAVWAVVGRSDGRPAPLSAAFRHVYGPSAAGAAVSARLSHPRPPRPDGGRCWPLRAADFDAAGHVNNAVHWAAVEDVIEQAGWRPARAELEYRRPLLPGCEPALIADCGAGEASAWLVAGPAVLASARLQREAAA